MDLVEDIAIGAVGGLALRGLQKLILQRRSENFATELAELRSATVNQAKTITKLEETLSDLKESGLVARLGPPARLALSSLQDEALMVTPSCPKRRSSESKGRPSKRICTISEERMQASLGQPIASGEAPQPTQTTSSETSSAGTSSSRGSDPHPTSDNLDSGSPNCSSKRKDWLGDEIPEASHEANNCDVPATSYAPSSLGDELPHSGDGPSSGSAGSKLSQPEWPSRPELAVSAVCSEACSLEDTHEFAAKATSAFDEPRSPEESTSQRATTEELSLSDEENLGSVAEEATNEEIAEAPKGAAPRKDIASSSQSRSGRRGHYGKSSKASLKATPVIRKAGRLGSFYSGVKAWLGYLVPRFSNQAPAVPALGTGLPEPSSTFPASETQVPDEEGPGELLQHSENENSGPSSSEPPEDPEASEGLHPESPREPAASEPMNFKSSEDPEASEDIGSESSEDPETSDPRLTERPPSAHDFPQHSSHAMLQQRAWEAGNGAFLSPQELIEQANAGCAEVMAISQGVAERALSGLQEIFKTDSQPSLYFSYNKTEAVEPHDLQLLRSPTVSGTNGSLSQGRTPASSSPASEASVSEAEITDEDNESGRSPRPASADNEGSPRDRMDCPPAPTHSFPEPMLHYCAESSRPTSPTYSPRPSPTRTNSLEYSPAYKLPGQCSKPGPSQGNGRLMDVYAPSYDTQEREAYQRRRRSPIRNTFALYCGLPLSPYGRGNPPCFGGYEGSGPPDATPQGSPQSTFQVARRSRSRSRSPSEPSLEWRNRYESAYPSRTHSPISRLQEEQRDDDNDGRWRLQRSRRTELSNTSPKSYRDCSSVRTGSSGEQADDLRRRHWSRLAEQVRQWDSDSESPRSPFRAPSSRNDVFTSPSRSRDSRQSPRLSTWCSQSRSASPTDDSRSATPTASPVQSPSQEMLHSISGNSESPEEGSPQASFEPASDAEGEVPAAVSSDEGDVATSDAAISIQSGSSQAGDQSPVEELSSPVSYTHPSEDGLADLTEEERQDLRNQLDPIVAAQLGLLSPRFANKSLPEADVSKHVLADGIEACIEAPSSPRPAARPASPGLSAPPAHHSGDSNTSNQAQPDASKKSFQWRHHKLRRSSRPFKGVKNLLAAYASVQGSPSAKEVFHATANAFDELLVDGLFGGNPHSALHTLRQLEEPLKGLASAAFDTLGRGIGVFAQPDGVDPVEMGWEGI